MSGPPARTMPELADIIDDALQLPGSYRAAGAGAVARSLWAKLREGAPVSLQDFGPAGAGVADSSAALIAMRNALLAADPNRHWRIHFPPGLYQYTNNRWLLGLRRFTVEAYGATFQCIANFPPLLAGDIEINPFGIHLPFDDHGDQPFTGFPAAAVNGALFDSAEPGADAITLLTPADAALFPPGTRVLLYGYSMQDGGPYDPDDLDLALILRRFGVLANRRAAGQAAYAKSRRKG